MFASELWPALNISGNSSNNNSANNNNNTGRLAAALAPSKARQEARKPHPSHSGGRAGAVILPPAEQLAPCIALHRIAKLSRAEPGSVIMAA